jgi:hypothetical protein
VHQPPPASRIGQQCANSKRWGVRQYSLGSGGWGGLNTFKQKVRPIRKQFPPPLTVVRRPRLYELCLKLFAFARRASQQ